MPDNNALLFIILTGSILGADSFDSGHNLLHQGKKLAIGILFYLQKSRFVLPDAFHCSHNAFFSSCVLIVTLRLVPMSICGTSFIEKGRLRFIKEFF